MYDIIVLELGRAAEGPEICPGPQKYGSFGCVCGRKSEDSQPSAAKPYPETVLPTGVS